MHVVCTIEARMGSTRLPGKMMETLVDDHTTLDCMIHRLERCQYPDEIVVATTTKERDDVIAEAASEHGVACFRGSEDDVLKRITDCAREHDADVICETTGDCPLAVPSVVDQTIASYLDNPRAEYVSNILARSWPHGLDVEVVSRETLEAVEAEANDPSYREHVTTYIRDRPADFDAVHVSPPPEYRDPSIRITLDYPADLELIRTVYDRLSDYGDPFDTGLDKLFAVFEDEPSLREINEEHVEFSADRGFGRNDA